MRALLLHCTTFRYRLVLDTPVSAADIIGRNKSVEDALVVFIAVESGDHEAVCSRMAKEVRKWVRRSGAAIILINPFAHLTAAPASAETALALSEALRDRLTETAEVPVEFTSFGWIKEFMCDVRGSAKAQIWIEIGPRG